MSWFCLVGLEAQERLVWKVVLIRYRKNHWSSVLDSVCPIRLVQIAEELRNLVGETYTFTFQAYVGCYLFRFWAFVLSLVSVSILGLFCLLLSFGRSLRNFVVCLSIQFSEFVSILYSILYSILFDKIFEMIIKKNGVP